jgi:hypothetical protein
MKHYFLIALLALGLWACMPEEEKISSQSGLLLRFSEDTVLFDTLLTNRGSITRRFRIYNPNDRAVRLSRIFLGKGEDSDYQLIINGREGVALEDEVLLGGDSLQVLVSVFVNPQDENLPYLVKDSVVVAWNGNEEHVKLVSWGQDAIFVNADTLCNVTWTADRPYVIYNYALVDAPCSLTVEAGAKIFLDNDAALFVQGSLQMLGTAEDRIIVKNTRFDEAFQEAPGQWDGIYFLEGSQGNLLEYCDISNGSIGLRIGTPDDDMLFDVEINQCIIAHMSNAGILAFTSDVRAQNTLIFNCGQYLVGNFAGGRYQYDHCTFSNFPNFFFRDEASVQFSDNVVLDENEVIGADLDITMRNSIIWGTERDELLIAQAGIGELRTDFSNGILKSSRPVNGFFVSEENNFPGFLGPQQFDYRLDSLAFAVDRAEDIGITSDLEGNPRGLQPDIGAFEWISEEN